jgi:hypothetical protein
VCFEFFFFSSAPFFSVFFFLFGGFFFGILFSFIEASFESCASYDVFSSPFFCFAFSVCGFLYDKLWFGISLCSVIT